MFAVKLASSRKVERQVVASCYHRIDCAFSSFDKLKTRRKNCNGIVEWHDGCSFTVVAWLSPYAVEVGITNWRGRVHTCTLGCIIWALTAAHVCCNFDYFFARVCALPNSLGVTFSVTKL